MDMLAKKVAEAQTSPGSIRDHSAAAGSLEGSQQQCILINGNGCQQKFNDSPAIRNPGII
jgi:hypothetical protein